MGVAASLVVGIDMGATSNNVTVLDATGSFLVDGLLEGPSQVQEGPGAALDALAGAFDRAIEVVGAKRGDVAAVGLGTPGPASATGVLSSRGATNFTDRAWWNFDIRAALEGRLQLPVTYINDCNAAALYAHHSHFGSGRDRVSSVSVIVGTGLGGGIVIDGSVVAGSAGMAGELGHVRIDLDGILEAGQPVPVCNCGRSADAESVASLTAIARNLLPYWLGRFPGHELGSVPLAKAARELRSFGEQGDPLARAVFDQQARAIGRLCTTVADVVDPDFYFIGGGVIEAAPEFRDWFVRRVEESLEVREEQARRIALVPDGDMAGARGAALVASGSRTEERARL